MKQAIDDIEDAKKKCEESGCDGVMLGRAAYHAPAMLADVDVRFFGGVGRGVDAALDAYLDYVERKLREGVPLNAMTKHMLGLFNGRPGARLFRRHLSENATRKGAGIHTLKDALAFVSREQPMLPNLSVRV